MAQHSLDASVDAFDDLVGRIREAAGPDTGPLQPRTRREARAMREALEAAQARTAVAPVVPVTPVVPVIPAVPATSAVQATAVVPVTPVAVVAATAPRATHSTFVPGDIACFIKAKTGSVVIAHPALSQRAKRRRTAFGASIAAALLVPALMFTVPANASGRGGQTAGTAQAAAQTLTTPDGKTAVQVLSVANAVTMPTVQQADYIANELAGIVVASGGEATKLQEPAIASALQVGGMRQTIVETALSYLGTPYVLGGSTRAGIDCSGLTMMAYAAAGITMPHLVSAQDAMGTDIPESEAQPGDLVVFDDDAHVALYLGAGQIVAAPDWGQNVQVQALSNWGPIGYHFTRVLPAGK